MRASDQPSADTSPLTKFSGLLMVAALTSTSDMQQVGKPSVPKICISSEPDDSCTFDYLRIRDFPASANTSTIGASVAEMSVVVTNLLAAHNLHPDRTSVTGDGSHLLQFFKHPTVEAGVDIFPNGDIVVIVRKNGQSRIFEAALSDLPKVPALLVDAGIAA